MRVPVMATMITSSRVRGECFSSGTSGTGTCASTSCDRSKSKLPRTISCHQGPSMENAAFPVVQWAEFSSKA